MNIFIPESIKELLRTFAFRGSDDLRPAGATIEYTSEMILEYIKCSQDPIYFITNYVTVVHPDRGAVLMKLYPFQEDMIRLYHENKRVVGMFPRQYGKCLSINTKVKLKQKSTNEIFECTLGEFYDWKKFKELSQTEGMSLLQTRI